MKKDLYKSPIHRIRQNIKQRCHVVHSRKTYTRFLSKLLKIIGLFRKRALQKRRYSAKEPYKRDEIGGGYTSAYPHVDLIW